MFPTEPLSQPLERVQIHSRIRRANLAKNEIVSPTRQRPVELAYQIFSRDSQTDLMGKLQARLRPTGILGRTYNRDLIRVDVQQHEQMEDEAEPEDKEEREKNNQLAETIAHERLHRKEWPGKTSGEEERIVDETAKAIMEELKSVNGEMSNCNVDWDP